jgi:hypothetical protein
MVQHVIETPTNPNATLADVWDVGGAAMTGGLASTAPQGAIRSGLSRSSAPDEIPLYRERPTEEFVPARPEGFVDPLDEPINWEEMGLTPPTPEWNNLTYRQWDSFTSSDELIHEALERLGLAPRLDNEDFALTALIDNENFAVTALDNSRLGQEISDRYMERALSDIAEDGLGHRSTVATFRSPVLEAIDSIQIPSKGIKGSDFLRALERNPSIRNSEVRSMGLDIDPQRRYTQEELREAVGSRAWEVTAETVGGNYRSYQRQPVLDPEQDYQEIVIRANREQGPTFEPLAGEGHFGRDVLAHARVSIRQPDSDGPAGPDNRPYVLIEELQSDLIQQGYQKRKAGNREEAIRNNLIGYSQDSMYLEMFDLSNLSKNFAKDAIQLLANSELERFLPQTLSSLRSRTSIRSTDARELREFLRSRGVRDESYRSINPFADFAEATGKSAGRRFARDIESLVDGIGDESLKSRVEAFDNFLSENYRINIWDWFMEEPRPNLFEWVIKEAQRSPTGAEGVILSALDNSLREARNIRVRDDTPPPITSNREFTSALVESVLAYAQRNGVDEVVFPPFEQIVAQRFNQGTEAYQRALEPSSGFYRTYVTGVSAFLEQLQREVGHNRVSVVPRELRYYTSDGLPSQGISINISGLSGLDLSRPRFAKGGLVTQTQQAFRGIV